MITNNKSLITGLFFLILLTILCYSGYWGNVWYLQDDYMTIEAGGANSIWESSKMITSWLYDVQQRYQPVRLTIFSIVIHIVPEEYSFFYNFGLHIFNIILLFLLIRKFRVNDYVVFLIVLLFSIFGVFKMIESPSAMIGGSGLNTFFIILSLLFLIIGLEASSLVKKWIFLCLSYLSYLGLVFSYEVAFPFITIVIFTFILFNFIYQLKPVFRYPLQWLIVAPYIFFLLFYYLMFYHTSGYTGARIEISWDILVRFSSYTYTLLWSLFNVTFSIQPLIIISLMLFFLCSYLLVIHYRKENDRPIISNYFDKNYLILFAFGFIWYISSVVLFSINTWISPTSVMHHHLYLMTVGFSIMSVMIIFGLYYVFSPKVGWVYKWIMVPVIFSLILINSIKFNIDYSKRVGENTAILYQTKRQIQKYIPDVEKIDAVLIKNFLMIKNPIYYNVSHFNGSMLQWFDFKKYLESGDIILSAKDDKITFKGPLPYHKSLRNQKTLIVDNKKSAIFFYDEVDKKLLAYHDTIIFPFIESNVTNFNGTEWLNIQKDRWLVKDGDLIYSQNPSNNMKEGEALVLSKNILKDYQMETTIKHPYDGGIVVRFVDDANWAILVYRDGNVYWALNVNGQYHEKSLVKLVPKSTSSLMVKVSASGNSINAIINNLKMKPVTVNMEYGRVGFYDFRSDQKQQAFVPHFISGNIMNIGKNIHQTKQVWGYRKTEDDNRILNAILYNNIETQSFLKITLDTTINPSQISNLVAIEINGEPVEKVYFSEDAIFVDISRLKANNNYFFLNIEFTGNTFLKKNIRTIGFIQAIKDTTPLLILKKLIPKFQKGWSGDEITHRWSVSKSADIEFLNDYQNSNSGFVEFSLWTLKPRTVKIFFNSNLVKKITLSPEQATNKISLQELSFNSGKNILKFETDIPPAQPGNGDPRSLSFAITELKIRLNQYLLQD
jgi:hypothetical protein